MRDKIFLKKRHSSHYHYCKNDGDWHHLEGKGKQSGNINWGTHHAVILNSSMQKDREGKVAVFLQPLAVCGQKGKVVLERGARAPLESAGAPVQRGQHFSFWGMCCVLVVFSFFLFFFKLKNEDVLTSPRLPNLASQLTPATKVLVLPVNLAARIL